MGDTSWGWIGHRPELPPVGGPDVWKDNGHATKCRTFLNYIIRYETMKRAELERAWNRARLYDANIQWLRPSAPGGGRLFFSWEPIRLGRKDAKFPMPKRNIFSPAMQNETARLIGVGSKPYVRLDDQSKEDGAKLAKDVLLDRLEKGGWDAQNRLGSYDAPLFGQWIQETRYEWDLSKVQRGPVTGAVKCPDCDFMLADSNVKPQEAMHLIGRGTPVTRNVDRGTGQARYSVDRCPACAQPMEPFNPPRAMWQQGQADRLGRPMYKNRPEGEVFTRNISPYSWFPENEGVGYQSDEEMMEWGFREPTSLLWLRSHYDNGYLVLPNRNMEAYRHHPVVAAWGLAYSAHGMWQNHSLLDRYYLRPCYDFPQGRAIEMAGPVLLYDGPYLYEGTDIPRSECAVAQWELRKGEIWGKPLSEDMHSVQDNINRGVSLAENMQDKWTSPKMILHEGMNLQFKGGANEAYAGDIWTVNQRGVPPDVLAKYPYVFGNQANTGNIWQMYDRDKDYVKEATGLMDSEAGAVSGVELNYSALLFAAGKSAERRKPRVQGFRALKRKTFRAMLRYMAAFYREDRLLHFRDDSDNWAVRQFQGFQLQDQTDVALEDEPLVDSAVALRASIEQGIEMQTVKTSAMGGSFANDRRINRAIGVPEALSEQENIQEDNARDEWKALLDDDQEPVIDQQADNDVIHWATHEGKGGLESREAKDLRDAMRQKGVPWENVLRCTYEWERLLKDMKEGAQLAQNPIPIEQLQATILDPMQLQQAMQQQQQVQERFGSFPVVLELQIQEVWLRLLRAHEVDISLPELLTLVRMKAHALGHWMRFTKHPLLLIDEAAKMPAIAKAMAAAPGGPAPAGGPPGPGPAPGGGGPAPAPPADAAAPAQGVAA